MRIAFLSPAAALGGAERCLVDLVVSLRRHAPQASIAVVAGVTGPLLDLARDAGADVHVVPMPAALARAGDSAASGGRRGALPALARAAAASLAAAAHARELSRALARLRPSVVHSNGMKHHVLGALARRAGAPLVWHLRDLVTPRPVMARALRLARRGAAGAIAISDAVREDLAAAVPGLACARVYDGIDVDAFSPGPEDPALLDRLAGRSPPQGAVLRVGLVATYARWKGQDVFIDAIARLPRDARSRARFYVVGGPIYDSVGSQFGEAELRERAALAGVAAEVGFVPFLPDPARAFRALDVAVHASIRREPFGRTIAEAMACGTPVVAARGAGAGELLGGAHAVEFDGGDPASLASALERLLADGALRERLAREGRSIAVARFSRDRLGPELLAAYRALGVAGDGPPG
jgi:glycosyltransferase involved in cell wall biosynthesis